MFSQFVGGKSPDRVFTYEVQGLRQTEETEHQDSPIRQSGSIFVNVSYERMNQEMQRISRLGGTIVSIKPYNGAGAASADEE